MKYLVVWFGLGIFFAVPAILNFQTSQGSNNLSSTLGYLGISVSAFAFGYLLYRHARKPQSELVMMGSSGLTSMWLVVGLSCIGLSIFLFPYKSFGPKQAPVPYSQPQVNPAIANQSPPTEEIKKVRQDPPQAIPFVPADPAILKPSIEVSRTVVPSDNPVIDQTLNIQLNENDGVFRPTGMLFNGQYHVKFTAPRPFQVRLWSIREDIAECRYPNPPYHPPAGIGSDLDEPDNCIVLELPRGTVLGTIEPPQQFWVRISPAALADTLRIRMVTFQ